MTEQPGRGRTKGDEPRTDLPPKREPYYEGYFGDEEDRGPERTTEEQDAPRAPRDGGGTGEGPL